MTFCCVTNYLALCFVFKIVFIFMFHSNKVDVWAIGTIFYQMLFGKRPFGDGLSQDKVLSNNLILKAREVRFPVIPSVSEESRRFIEQCLMYEQQNRPTIADLCRHPYVLRSQLIDSSN